MATATLLDTPATDWRQRLDIVVEAMRDMSCQTDAQEMVRAYTRRMRWLTPAGRFLSLSRRDLEAPKYRITRSSTWKENINPWKQKDRLPVLEGGLLGELLYGDEPRIIDELEFSPDDPAAEYLVGMRSLAAIPNYDQGIALNMTLRLSEHPAAFDREEFPEQVLMSNLFGRAAHNLVLADEVQQAYREVDRELKAVGNIQRSLLPAQLPEIPTMQLAAYYQTARRAGGDYYDFFPLPTGQWGILLADVSGHGTPAAVMMAITHSIAHSFPGPPAPANTLFDFVNSRLAAYYTAGLGSFVTAFYGIYDPTSRMLSYASAGHNPPRLKRCAEDIMMSLDGVSNLPLGVSGDERYQLTTLQLQPGDQIIFYTDGITETHNRGGQMYGVSRLDQVLAECRHDASELIDAVLASVDEFSQGLPADDDRTLVVAKIS